MDGFLTGALGKEGWEISENDNILQVRFLKEAPSTEILKALDTITGDDLTGEVFLPYRPAQPSE